jgi:TrmH family RNA methyltransferase
LQDPGNVGTIIRTAEAFGIDGVILSEDCCDLYNPKVLRAAMGTAFRVPILQLAQPTESFLQQAAEAGCNTIASVVSPDAMDMRQTTLKKSNILLIGNEGNGLPDAVTALCSQAATIHMRGKAESLNAAMAAGVLLWELTSRADS